MFWIQNTPHTNCQDNPRQNKGPKVLAYSQTLKTISSVSHVAKDWTVASHLAEDTLLLDR